MRIGAKVQSGTGCQVWLCGAWTGKCNVLLWPHGAGVLASWLDEIRLDLKPQAADELLVASKRSADMAGLLTLVSFLHNIQ